MGALCVSSLEMAPSFCLCVLLLFACTTTFVHADDETHHYNQGDKVIVWTNKVGPYHNPQETYSYYSLPFCKANEAEERTYRYAGLGEVLEGNELISSDFLINFRVDVPSTTICTMTLDEQKARAFRYAISNHYWYQFYVDDLPLLGMVGEVMTDEPDDLSQPIHEHEEVYIYTSKKFTLSYNDDQIIEVNLTYHHPVPVAVDKQLEFTYSVEWVPTTQAFSSRFARYLDYSFFEHQIHWFSIFNSFMMVIFLCGLVFLILMRTLRKDYAKYAKDEDDLDNLDKGVGEESGWKQVHGDVFRAPDHLVSFSALLGTGSQLACLVALLILLANSGSLYTERGSITSTAIFCYALTSFVAGYTGGGYYARNNGRHWIKTMLLTASLFPGVCFSIAFSLNLIAVAYQSMAAIPLGTSVLLVLLWGFISCPLTLVGTIVGRHWSGQADNPCRVNALRRPIPDKKWYTKPLVVILLGGVLPFGSIFIEMYFIFTSFWNYKFYYVYGFMLLVFGILVIVLVCVSIVGTYFLLNAEDYRWAWTSFLSAASTALYVFSYAVYYFFAKTKMSGFFQTCFYFGYTGMFCLGLALFCGTVGFLGTNVFVRRIYRFIKSD